MADKWYVVHCNTGSEDTVKRYINTQMKMDNCLDLITDILVPTETIEEQLKGGRKKTSEKKFFPGYLLVKTELNEESWHFLRNIPKVIGFVGGKVKDGKLLVESVPTVDESEINKMRNKIDLIELKNKLLNHKLLIANNCQKEFKNQLTICLSYNFFQHKRKLSIKIFK